MRIIIVGAGAIGAATAAYMHQAGIDVTLVCHAEAAAATIRERGLQISGIRGKRLIPLPAISSPAELTGVYDYAVIATKTYDAALAASSILPWLSEDGLVLFLQNGVCVEEQAAAVGKERLVSGIVTWAATLAGPAAVDITGEGGFIIGQLPVSSLQSPVEGNLASQGSSLNKKLCGAKSPSTGNWQLATGNSLVNGVDEKMLALKSALETMAPTVVSEDIFAAIYAKLIINSAITCGGALSGQRLGCMLLTGRARRFFIAIVREDMALAQALGIKVPPFGGRLDYYRFIAGNGLCDDLRRHITLLVIGLRYWRLKSSSLTALERGRPTEVDALNGWISAAAAALGVKTPVNDAVVRLIKEIEAGQRGSRPENLNEII